MANKVYPRVKYHQTHPPIVVKSEQHEERLGDDWKDTPADFGVITHPSPKQREIAELGYDPEMPVASEEEAEAESGEDGEVRTPRRRGR